MNSLVNWLLIFWQIKDGTILTFFNQLCTFSAFDYILEPVFTVIRTSWDKNHFTLVMDTGSYFGLLSFRLPEIMMPFKNLKYIVALNFILNDHKRTCLINIKVEQCNRII